MAYTVDFMGEFNATNPEFVVWLGDENPWLYNWLRDGEFDDYERKVLLTAAGLKKLAPYSIRMPEAYTKEADLTDVLSYMLVMGF